VGERRCSRPDPHVSNGRIAVKETLDCKRFRCAQNQRPVFVFRAG
jgi:hypothetical protein